MADPEHNFLARADVQWRVQSSGERTQSAIISSDTQPDGLFAVVRMAHVTNTWGQ